MYTYDYDDKKNSYFKIFIKLIVIITLILLLVWIFYSNTRTKKEDIDSNSFTKNFELVEKNLLLYFNKSRLPKNIGQYERFTMSTLIDKDIIKDIKVDHSMKCDRDKSFIILRKKADNLYKLKIVLNCGKESDYIEKILVHESYCKGTYLCEKVTKEPVKKDNENSEEKQEQVTNSYSTSDDTSKPKYKYSGTHNYNRKKTNTNTKGSIIIKDTTKKNKLYEYKKLNIIFSPWSKLEKVSCDTKSITCSNNDKSCIKEISIINGSSVERISNKYYVNHKVYLKTNEWLRKSCHDYIILNGTKYQLDSEINSYESSFSYIGKVVSIHQLEDTINTKYVITDIKVINNTITSYYYDKYVSNLNFKILNNTNNMCDTLKKVYVYDIQNKNYEFIKDTSTFKPACFKKERIKYSDYYNYKWSNYDDKKLLNNGYTYTGRIK